MDICKYLKDNNIQIVLNSKDLRKIILDIIKDNMISNKTEKYSDEKIDKDKQDRIDELRTLKKEIYTSKETAEILDISTHTLRKMRDNNEIGFSTKNGSPKVWFLRKDIIGYLNKKEVRHEVWKYPY